MARRGEEYARLNPGGGYTQALTVGKGFSGADRSAAKYSGSENVGGRGVGSSGTMSAFARHQELIRNYHRYNLNAQVPSSGAIEAKGLPGQKKLTDSEALRRQHRFVRDEEEDRKAEEARGLEGTAADPSAWEVRMASKYYKLLFKEYALADLSRYREDKVGLRWRTEKDVVSGKGQFECGALQCQERRDLHSYELNFKYKEAGVVKSELVKVRVCPQCARKLYRKKIEALRLQRKIEEEELERERRRRKKAGLPLDELESRAEESRPPSSSAGDCTSTSLARTDPRGSAYEGHELVRQAIGAAGPSGGTNSGKRRKPSRWVDKINVADSGVATGDGVDGEVAGGDNGAGGAGGARAGVDGDVAARRAWAGELERDRTAEDEMDDYLSSLLL